MTGTAVAAAASVLSRPGLAPVVDELARRMGASERPVASVTVLLAGETERVAVAGLLGMSRLPPARLQIRTDRLAAAVGVDATDLRAVVEAVAGQLGNRSAVREHAQRTLASATTSVTDAAGPLGEATAAWAAAALRQLPGPVEDRTAVVLAAIAATAAPRERRLPLPVLAADLLGDPHAFDPGTRGASVLIACVAATAGVEVPRSALERRRLLAQFGIVADELSSTVAVWRFPFPADHPLVGMSAALSSAGEPFVLTLSMLQRWPVAAPAAQVLVVENPAVLAVAAADGHEGAIVCSSGQPSAACVSVVHQLTQSGTDVRVHADFDPGGFGIVTRLRELGATPWRMGVAEYRAALALAGSRTVTGPVPVTPWDPELAAVFAEERRPVYEEQVLDTILAELPFPAASSHGRRR